MHKQVYKGNATDLNNLLNEVQTRLAKRLKITHDLANNRLNEAETMLNALPKNTDEDIYFDYLHRLLLQKMQNNESIYILTPNQEAMLLNIAQSQTATAHKAQAWLYAAKGTEFELNTGDIKLEEWAGVSTTFKTTSPKNTLAVLYPNPAQNELRLYYQPQQTDAPPASLSIKDFAGTTIYQTQLPTAGSYTINTSTWATGIYFCEISQANATPITQKVLIVR